ncbi:MAG: hypothetical protein ACE5JG_08945, partial [Planctomycetota bacterium]
TAELKQVESHLERLASDRRYASIQKTLSRVRVHPALSAFPFVHAEAGPFLVFYSARDLTVIEGEDPEEERARVRARREVYRKLLETRAHVYRELLEDLHELYPSAVEARPLPTGRVFIQWVFADAPTYSRYLDLIDARPIISRPGRRGHLDPRNGWAVLYDDTGDDEGPVLETAAFLAAHPVLRAWIAKPEGGGDPLGRVEALWLLEGWPAFLAARRVPKPEVGDVVGGMFKGGARLPPVRRVVEQRSWHDVNREPATKVGDDDEVDPVHIRTATFPGLAWSLVEALHQGANRARMTRFLLSVLGGDRGGSGRFETVFGIRGEGDWRGLDESLVGFWGARPRSE